MNFLKKRDFYFVHSFTLNKIDLVKTNKEFIIGKTSHGNVDFISLILTTNLIATQFHPEKSGNSGIELLSYFYGKKRVIFKLIFKDDAFHLSRNFSLQRAGDTNWLFDKMNFQKISDHIDELIILNASKNNSINPLPNFFKKSIEELMRKTFIPLTIGGGLTNLGQIDECFELGADKIILTSAVKTCPELIDKLFQEIRCSSCFRWYRF